MCLVLAIAGGALTAPPSAHARPTIITGVVLGEGLRPLAGARVRVVGEDACATTTRPNGAFELSCEARGPREVEATFDGLPASRVSGVLFEADRLAQLTFLLQPAAAPPPPPASGWSAPLGNPTIGDWNGRPVSLRMLAVAVAIAAFLLGLACLLLVARALGVERRRLTEGETADLVLNAGKRFADRVQPVALVGARGAEWSTSYGAEEIAAALHAGRYGLVLASLLAPALIALAVLGFFLAMLVGEPRYLFALALLVPAGFLVTPLVILGQAITRRRRS